MSRRDRRGAPSGSRPKPPAEPRHEVRLAAAPEHPTALLALALTLALLVLLRGMLSFVPGMGGWSLNLHRFVAPWIGWSLWLLSALALIPALGERLLPWWEAMGHAIERQPSASVLVAALFGGA